MGHHADSSQDEAAGKVPAASPNPAGNTGYAEPMPRNKEQAQIPGANPQPDSEDGGLEHDPDATL